MPFNIKVTVVYTNGKSDVFDFELKIPNAGEPRRKSSK
jgi:hypothetical protein